MWHRAVGDSARQPAHHGFLALADAAGPLEIADQRPGCSMSRSSASTTTNTLTDLTHHGRQTDVIAPPSDAEGGLFSETNGNSVAILLTSGMARVLSSWPATPKQRRSSTWPAVPTLIPWPSIYVRKHKTT